MALRLLLVGMVASLGLDLPTGWRVESWNCAGRSWFESRKSEWQELTATTPVMDGEEIDEPPVSSSPVLVQEAKASQEQAPTTPSSIEVVDEPALIDVPVTATPAITTIAPIEITDSAAPAVNKTDEAFSAVVEQIVVGFSAPADEPSKTTMLASEVARNLIREKADEIFSTVLKHMVGRFAEPAKPGVETLVAVEPPSPDEAFGVIDDLPPTQLAESKEKSAVPSAVVAPPALDASEWIGATPEEVASSSLAIPVAEEFRGEAQKPSRNDRLAAAVRLTGEALQAWARLLDERPEVVAVQH
jgi:hypothetical protein